MFLEVLDKLEDGMLNLVKACADDGNEFITSFIGRQEEALPFSN